MQQTQDQSDWTYCFLRLCVLIAAVMLLPAAGLAETRDVVCGGSGVPYPTIASALGSLPVNSTSEPHRINVTGTCYESVSIWNRQRITIQASGQTATIDAGESNTDVLYIGKSRGIVLKGLVIRGGSRGVKIDDSSEVDMDQCTIEDTGGTGILVSDLSNLRLDRATIQNNGSTGLVVDDSSYATLGEMILADQGETPPPAIRLYC